MREYNPGMKMVCAGLMLLFSGLIQHVYVIRLSNLLYVTVIASDTI